MVSTVFFCGGEKSAETAHFFHAMQDLWSSEIDAFFTANAVLRVRSSIAGEIIISVDF